MIDAVFVQGFWAALVAGLITGVGGFMIFLKKKYSQEYINTMLSIAAGVMLSASFFALLAPSMSQLVTMISDIHIAGFWYAGAVFCGVALIWILNAVLPHEHAHMGHHGLGMSSRAAWLFIIAITIHKIPEGLAMGIAYGAENLVNPESLTVGIALHNIPEGLAVGVAFASAHQQFIPALILSIGIGIQNFPEGTAIALPMHQYGKSRFVSMMYGQFSGIIEIPAAILGYIFASLIQNILPFALSFAAGAMLFVCVEDMIPEACCHRQIDIGALSCMIGFTFMMILDIMLS